MRAGTVVPLYGCIIQVPFVDGCSGTYGCSGTPWVVVYPPGFRETPGGRAPLGVWVPPGCQRGPDVCVHMRGRIQGFRAGTTDNSEGLR